jgi:citronellol/citronellal dehydrogenase
MRRGQGGHIINISSIGAIGPGEGPYDSVGGGGSAYGSGKAHLERFTQGMAEEVWQDGIAVNALSPRRAIASEGQRWFRGGQPYAGAREDGEIMGDAGVIVCQQDPRTYTGKILYDEDVLAEAGVTDLSRYAVIPD